MSKHPKSIVVSFRLNPIIIAKTVDGLKTYDKIADITTLSGICKQAFLHGVNYLTHSLPFEASESSKILVHRLTTQGKGRPNFSIEREILGSNLTWSKAIHEDVETKAEKKVITDWTITDDMREGEEE
jgi:hypothetical protein